MSKHNQVICMIIGWIIMGIVFSLALNYLLFIKITDSFIYGFILSFTTIVLHEMAHELVSIYVCGYKNTYFSVTRFAFEASLISIFVLSLLIWIKQIYRIEFWFVPIIASPGAVIINKLKVNKCINEIAFAGPLTNFIIGVISLFYLLSITKPPFILNSGNTQVVLISLICYFSFALAMINLLPLKIGSIELDGYHAIYYGKNINYKLLVLVLILLIVSIYILFITKWWEVIISGWIFCWIF